MWVSGGSGRGEQVLDLDEGCVVFRGGLNLATAGGEERGLGLKLIARAVAPGGEAGVDGAEPRGGRGDQIVTRGVVRLQTGYLYHYAFAMMIGIAALISWFMFGGAH